MITNKIQQKLINELIDATFVNTEKQTMVLKALWLESPLGTMLAISDDHALYLLEFIDRRGLENEIKRLCAKTNAAIIFHEADPITSIKAELESYFAGKLKKFNTSFYLLGSNFQELVWHALQDIKYGQTNSYAELATTVGNKFAFRAVANANGANQLAIIIPCHHVINSNGNLGGYGAGVSRKKWLLDFERQHCTV